MRAVRCVRRLGLIERGLQLGRTIVKREAVVNVVACRTGLLRYEKDFP